MRARAATSEARLERLLAAGVRLDLAPFRALLAALGDPQRAAPALIVAGTNGKGSVATLADAALRAAGYRTALATSPHLERPHERVRLDGIEIGERELAALLDRLLAAAPGPPTYFEALVAVALLAGAEAGVDAFVLEVGLGGRLDATNACDAEVAAVTRIALDHTAELGPTLAAIAREKAGVFRGGRPAIVAPQEPEAAAALTAAARAVGARERRVADTVTLVSREPRGLAGQRLRLATARDHYTLDLALPGAHQADNAATAVAALQELAAARFPALDRAAIEHGFAAARWPGRLEALDSGVAGITLLVDAAHNPDGCRALAHFLAELGRPHVLLFGALADKDAAAMLAALAPGAAAVVLARPDSPRALDPAALASAVPGCAIEPDPERALALALGRAAERGLDLVVAAGSIYLIAPLRARRASG